MVRVVMRRAGVSPWLATAAAAILVLFGPGDINATFAVQVSMLVSMLCGFGQLVLADHDGGIDRRDWIGLGLGAVGLMSSGIAPLLVIAVGIATLLRRSVKVAAFQTVPLAALYVVWFLTQRSTLVTLPGPSIRVMFEWVVSGEVGTFVAIGGFGVVAVALFALLVGGLAMAFAQRGWSGLRRTAAVPLALLVVTPALFASASRYRWLLGTDAARAPHYVGLAAAMLLPALAVAADALVRRTRWLLPVVVVVLLAGIVPAALDFTDERHDAQAWYFQDTRRLVLAAAHSPRLAGAPEDLRLDPREEVTADLTAGFLRRALADGKVPDPGVVDPVWAATAAMRLSLRQTSVAGEGADCRVAFGQGTLAAERGDRILLDGSTLTITGALEGGLTLPSTYTPVNGRTIVVEQGGMALTVTSAGGTRFRLCGSAA
jgi:hypothetical protein